MGESSSCRRLGNKFLTRETPLVLSTWLHSGWRCANVRQERLIPVFQASVRRGGSGQNGDTVLESSCWCHLVVVLMLSSLWQRLKLKG